MMQYSFPVSFSGLLRKKIDIVFICGNNCLETKKYQYKFPTTLKSYDSENKSNKFNVMYETAKELGNNTLYENIEYDEQKLKTPSNILYFNGASTTDKQIYVSTNLQDDDDDTSVKFEGETMARTDSVSKGEFDAHMKRIDEGIRHIDEKMNIRFSSLEEKFDLRFSSLETNINRLTDTIVEQRKEIHSDNIATRMTNYAVLATAVLGFLAVLITLLR